MFDTWSGDGPLALREPLGENPSVPDPTTQKIRNGDTDTDHTDHTDPEEDIIFPITTLILRKMSFSIKTLREQDIQLLRELYSLPED